MPEVPTAWRAYRSDRFPSESWARQGDVLRAIADGPKVDLVSDRAFGDFDLSFQWRLPPGGNSGVLYRVLEEREATWQSGLEMQLLDDAGHPDGRNPATSCGALYGLRAPRDVPAVSPGRFVAARIVVRGDHVEHWLDGVRVLACDTAEDAFAADVAHSKFARFPAFGRAARGHIALQHHGSEVEFRHVRIDVPPHGRIGKRYR